MSKTEESLFYCETRRQVWAGLVCQEQSGEGSLERLLGAIQAKSQHFDFIQSALVGH